MADDYLTLGGQPINPTPPKKTGRPFGSPNYVPKPIVVPPPRSLQDQHLELWAHKMQVDPRLKGFERRLRDLKYMVQETQRRMSLRRAFLKEEAFQIVAKKNGVTQIPGYNSRRQRSDESKTRWLEKIKKLREAAKVALPAEIQPPPANEQEPRS